MRAHRVRKGTLLRSGWSFMGQAAPNLKLVISWNVLCLNALKRGKPFLTNRARKKK